MGSRVQQREEIRVQEYVRLQETFNTIIRSLERIERLDNIKRTKSVKINPEADRIHCEYSSVRVALITQCFCLQVGMTNPKFQNEQVKSSLRDQVNLWTAGTKGVHSDKVLDALSIIEKAISGNLNFDDFETGGMPEDHSQAVESILIARRDLEEKSILAASNPKAYYEGNEYGLSVGKKFGKTSNEDDMEVNEHDMEVNEHDMEVDEDCTSKTYMDKSHVDERLSGRHHKKPAKGNYDDKSKHPKCKKAKEVKNEENDDCVTGSEERDIDMKDIQEPSENSDESD